MNAKEIIQRLVENGYDAKWVGGCVRDELLGLLATDEDIATNAAPEAIRTLFANSHVDQIGQAFPVMLVEGIEVATYRAETYFVAGKPEVRLIDNFFDDSSRRDFTINAMGKNVDGTIVDYHGGQMDLKNRVIRAVGNPLERFEEDPSRILRGMYLASRLGFTLDEGTQAAMITSAATLTSVPAELIGKIIHKVIVNNGLASFLCMVRDTQTLKYVFPELVHTVGMPQNPAYHNSKVFEHIVRVVADVQARFPGDEEMALAALYHDCPKGMEGIRSINKNGQPSDLGHEEAAVPIAEKALRRYNVGNKTIHMILFLIAFHGVSLERNPNISAVIRMLRRMTPSFSNKEELTEAVFRLYDFKDSDAAGFDPAFGEKCRQDHATIRPVLTEVIASTIFYRGELPVDGKDLLAWGIRGKEIGVVLEELVVNNVQTREAVVKRLIKKGFVIKEDALHE